MAKELLLRRGTTAENNLFVGALAEPSYDTERKEIRVHDGSTPGGKVVSTATGMVAAFAGSAAPEGWLVCDGSEISRIDYADLFAVIGTTYGDGDGVLTFNLPNQTPSHKVIEIQEPTSGNNWTWYRLYDDGWVEQGGKYEISPARTDVSEQITFPVSFSESQYYYATCCPTSFGYTNNNTGFIFTSNKTSTTCIFHVFINYNDVCDGFNWFVSGKSARGTTQQNIMCIKY